MTPAQFRTVQHLAAKNRVFLRAEQLTGSGNWDPLDTLVEIALGAPLTTAGGLDTGPLTAADPELRLSAAKELAKFLHPTLKAIEHTGPDGGDIPIRHSLVDDIVQLARSAKLKPQEPAA
jgi:hypothetical protein